MTTAFSDIVVPQEAAFKANISAGSILVSTLSKGAKSTNDGKVVVDGLVSLAKIAESIRRSAPLATQTAALRAALEAEGRDGKYATDKLRMPVIMPASQAPGGTPIAKLPPASHANGLYGFDIDEHREEMDLAATRAALIAAPGCVMVGMSCAGNALFAIFAGPCAATDAEYKRHWEAIAAAMPESAKANNGAQSKNFNRLRFLAHDPDVWLADTVTPLAGALELEPQARDSESRASTAPSDVGDHAVDADALARIEPPTEYNAWYGWLPTLKALGFTVGEVDAWSKQGAGYQEGVVAAKWESLPKDEPDKARDKLRGHAYKLGWRRTRTQRPAPRPATVSSSGSCEPLPSNDWLGFGAWWARKYGRGRFIFVTDPTARGWWGYVCHVWRPLLNTELLADELQLHRYRYADEAAKEGRGGFAQLLADSLSGAAVIHRPGQAGQPKRPVGRPPESVRRRHSIP